MRIRDIARMAGVSPATVSRVLNHPDIVKEDTRKRVLEVIERLGYEPNGMARALRMRRSGNVGMIVPVESGSIFESPYFGLFLKGASEVIESRDYHLILSTAHQRDTEIYRSFMKKKIVDGFIVVDVLDEDPRIDLLRSEEFPFVVVGRPKHFEDLVYVDSDNFSGAYTATEYLIKTRHERIALVNGPKEHSVSRWRLEGYEKALLDNRIDFSMVLNGTFTEESGYELTKKALEEKVDAILYSGDVMAFGGMEYLKDAGLRVGKDVSIIGFDDVPSARLLDLSSVRQPIVEVGREAFRMLLEMIDGRKVESKLFETELVLRGSVRV